MGDTGEPGGLQWANLVYIFQPSSLALIGTAVLTVGFSAVRALKYDDDSRRSGASQEMTVTLDQRQALAMPLVSSCILLALFYVFDSIQLVLLLFISLFAAYALFLAAEPLIEIAAGRKQWLRQRLVLCSKFHIPLGELLLGGIAVFTVLSWLFSGSMILNNLLGTSLCVAFITLVRMPNVRIVTQLLGALFVYDCFWVFFSQRIFGSNVMVDAATKQADNPAFQMAEALHLPSASIARELDLPVKLMFPQSLLCWDRGQPALMLGLGDIALPGMLISLLLSNDVAKWRLQTGGSETWDSTAKALSSSKFWRESYVLPSWVGYAVGMFLALGVGTVWQAAQPALFYLVPATLGPLFMRAFRRRELREVWEGFEHDKVGGKEVDV